MDTLKGKLPMTDTLTERLRLLLVVTWKEEGEWYLYRRLTARCRCVEILQPARGTGHYPKCSLEEEL